MSPQRVEAVQGSILAALSAVSLASVVTAIGQDPFVWAWLILVAFTVTDYVIGVSAAKNTPVTYSPRRRAQGKLAKTIVVVLMIFVRIVEGWAAHFGVLDTSAVLRWSEVVPANDRVGILAAVLTMIAAINEMGSIYGHGRAAGGPRMLLLELIFYGITAVQRKLLGKATAQTAAWAGADAGDSFTGDVQALRQIDERNYAREHGGAMAPRQRHMDAADEDLRSVPYPQEPADLAPPSG